ncbi:MAG: acetoacetate--CoA ligase [Deltaproteobacteria bacterium]|nr:acetoacetate--CoA ligase [Deltaproteobacteria bacterium]
MNSRLWAPSTEVIGNANITRFIESVNRRYQKQIKTYAELYDWSVGEIAEFWQAVSDFTEIQFATPPRRIVDDPYRMPAAKWFEGARLNFAQNLLRFADQHTALIARREDGVSMRVSYAELRQKVARLARALREMGVAQGDRVAAYMPNSVETVVAMLATASIGALWASCAVDIRPSAVIDRFGQIAPKVLFAVAGYVYKGKRYDSLADLTAVVEGIPSLQRVIVSDYLGQRPELGRLPQALAFEQLLSTEADCDFEPFAFEHPLYIMFSSGTTGKPKCMVQSAGGVLINHLNELVIHTDLKREDTIFYITTCSWMMWNWLLSSLAVGATVLLYDGSPLYPDADAVWEIIQDEEVTIFGTSASFIEHIRAAKSSPIQGFDLGGLRQISQTGSVLSAAGFAYVYREIKSDLHFNSISGGTDINGCFAIGNPTLPVYAGQTQARGLGKKVKAYDRNGKAVVDRQGELVCEAAVPSMPLYFWNDPNGDMYRDAYFSIYPGVWRHGDYVVIHGDTGGMTFYGRSDSVLMPSGVRIGTAEIYREMEKLEEVDDSLAVGQRHQSDERILLFVKLKPEYDLTDKLIDKIKKTLRRNASPRHVPARVIETPDIPYTLNMKKVESAVANIINGRPVANRDALINPESLDFFRNFSDLEK